MITFIIVCGHIARYACEVQTATLWRPFFLPILHGGSGAPGQAARPCGKGFSL